jgi:hypothetical protein
MTPSYEVGGTEVRTGFSVVQLSHCLTAIQRAASVPTAVNCDNFELTHGLTAVVASLFCLRRAELIDREPM